MDKDSEDIVCAWKGEWVAKSQIELARPCSGEDSRKRDCGGIQTAVRGVISPVKWGAEISNPMDAQESGFKMVDEWIGAYGPKLREATMKEIRDSERPANRFLARMSGKHPLASYEEYRSSCERQRKGFGAKVPSEERSEKIPRVEMSERAVGIDR